MTTVTRLGKQIEQLATRIVELELNGGGGGGAPDDAQYVVLATDATLTNERVLVGTTNQVVVTDGGAGGNVVLSAPQNIHTGATPTFAGVTLSGISADRVLFTTTGGLVTSSGAMTFASGIFTLTGNMGVASILMSGALTASAMTADRIAFINGSNVLSVGTVLQFDGTTLVSAVNNTSTTPQAEFSQASTGDAAVRFALGSARSYAVGIDNSASDAFVIATAASGSAVLGTGNLVSISTGGSMTITGSRYSLTGAYLDSQLLAIEPSNTSDVSVSFGGNISGGTARNTYLDLTADTTYTDYGVRWIRSNGGANTTTEFLHRGTGSMVFKGLEANKVEFGTSNTTGLALTVNRYVVVGAGLTEPSSGLKPVLIIEQGDSATNPSGMPSNTCGIFGKNSGTTCELFTIDEAGNVTQQTPHAIDGPVWMRWDKWLMPDLIFHDANAYIGASRYTNITLMAAALEWAMGELEQLGRAVPSEFAQFVYEEKVAEPLSWGDYQDYLHAQRLADIQEWDSRPSNPLLPPKPPRPALYERKAIPEWVERGQTRNRGKAIGANRDGQARQPHTPAPGARS